MTTLKTILIVLGCFMALFMLSCIALSGRESDWERERKDEQ